MIERSKSTIPSSDEEPSANKKPTLKDRIKRLRAQGTHTYVGPSVRNGWEYAAIDSPRDLEGWLTAINEEGASESILIDILPTRKVIIVWDPEKFPKSTPPEPRP